MDLKKSEGGGGITRLLPDGRLGSHYCAFSGLKKEPPSGTGGLGPASMASNANESNLCFPHHVMATVPQIQQQNNSSNHEKTETFSDLLTSVLSPEEASVGFEAASACVDLSALDGLNLDFPPMNSNNSNNYNSVSEVVAAAIMATSEDSEAQNFSSGKNVFPLFPSASSSICYVTQFFRIFDP